MKLNQYTYNRNICPMKKIEAIVRASKFEDVKEALSKNDVNFFTFYEVKGYGHEKSKNITYRGAVYDVGYIARIKLEIIITDEFLEPAVNAILNAAKTGQKGDGLIMTSDIDDVINIRTDLVGSKAINS